MSKEERLWEKTIWLNSDIDFIFGANIVEYDMKSAGLSLIKEFKLLDKNTINELDKMTKDAKNKKIGLIQRSDKEFTNKLSLAFKEARRRFMVANNLEYESILSIKKDAIFVIDSLCKNLEFGNIFFQKKNVYTTFFKLNRIEFFFNVETNHIDLKGLGQGDDLERVIQLHGPYLLDFMMKFATLREYGISTKNMRNFLKNFIVDYRERNLDINYYRELDKGLGFELFDEAMGEYIKVSETDDKKNVNIITNYIHYIMPLVGLYL